MLGKSFILAEGSWADWPNALKRALDLRGVKLHVGAFRDQSYFPRHQPEALKANAAFRAAVRPGCWRGGLRSHRRPDADRRSARQIDLQAQTLTAAGFVDAQSRLEPVAHFLHGKLRAKKPGAFSCQGVDAKLIELLQIGRDCRGY